MAIKFSSTKQTVEHINCLVYGEAGIGKTTLCATAPSPLIISAEAGLLSLKKHDIPVYEIKEPLIKAVQKYLKDDLMVTLHSKEFEALAFMDIVPAETQS